VASTILFPDSVLAAGSQPSTTTIASSQNPSALGTAVTYTATVSGTSGTPTGTVTFTDATTLCSGATLTPINGSSASATCTEGAPAMSAGSHTITATYNGNSTYQTSTDSITQTVQQGSTTTAAGSSLPSGFMVGVPVTYAATVTAGETAISPGGTVTFTDNSSPLCTVSSPVTSSGGSSRWTCTEPGSSMTLGPHSIVATYAGDANFTGSDNSATPFIQAVSKNATMTTLSSSSNPSPVGTEVTYTATIISGSGVTAFSPTGTVTFTDGLTTVRTDTSPNTSASGVSTYTCLEPASSMTAGSRSIGATYNGDANFTGSNGSMTQTVNSASQPLTVNRAGTSMDIAITASTVAYSTEQDAVLSAAVTSDTTGTPTGTVVFTTGVVTLCTATLTGGVGSCTSVPTALDASATPYPVVASYEGDRGRPGTSSRRSPPARTSP